MNSRIKQLRESVLVNDYPLCVEKANLVIESFRRTEGQPRILAIARAFDHFLKNMTIFIEENELLVGNAASKPMGFEADHLDVTWTREDFEELRSRGLSVSKEDEEKLRNAVDEYYANKGRTFIELQAQVIDDERLWPFVQTGIVLPPWQRTKEEGIGHGGGGSGWSIGATRGISVVDYATPISKGLKQLIKEAEEELRNLRIFGTEAIRKSHFLQAVIISYKALIAAAERFSDLAKDMAAKEKNPARKKELEKISEICRKVPANPAGSFYEALQSFYFIWIAAFGATAGGGRFDQYMYPYYKKDIDEGKITREEALELLECLRVKTMQTNVVFGGKIQRDKWAGYARWNNFIIGGLTPDGRDATNDLTYMMLEAAKDCQTPHFTMSLRVHEGTPEPLLLKALEVIKTGIGMPAMLGDKSYIDFFLSRGVSLYDARNYAVGGCLDSNIPGKSGIAGASMFVVPLVFEIFMNNGIEPKTGRQLGPKTGEFESYKSFDELVQSFKKQLAYFLGMGVEFNNIWTMGNSFNPDPFGSALYEGAIKEGKNCWERKLPFENGTTLNPVGMVNVVDSFAAIKKYVFDEKKVTLKELKAALSANWQGNGYSEMRKMLAKAPKFGNGDEYVDSIARDLYKFFADTVITFDNAFGGKTLPGGVSITSHGPGGMLTGATPDGRYAGENLADGTMSPAQGRDIHGPTAVLQSALAIDQIPWSSTLLNMKFHPSSLNTTEDMRKLSDLIKIYFNMGGKHIQFNVVSKETLKDAQVRPEEHRDLIVRVAGYSAYYVQLTKAIQNDILARTELEINK
jgi:pyruvate formate-lyase/glycerol dehydratase family glycyl radical enzyme